MRTLLVANSDDVEKISRVAKDFGKVTKVADADAVVPSIEAAAEEGKRFDVLVLSDEVEEFTNILKMIEMFQEGRTLDEEKLKIIILTNTFHEQHTKKIVEAAEVVVRDFFVKPYIRTSVVRMLEAIELEQYQREIEKPELDMTILAVEDSPVTRRQLRILLRKLACVVTVESAEEMFEEISSINPDIITMDVGLPGITGIQACERLRNTPGYSDIPVIFITAREGRDDELAMFKAGSNDFVKKPFGSFALKARVKNQLLRRRAELELQKETEQLSKSVRKLDCLFSISDIIMDPNISTEELVNRVIKVIPAASVRPEAACARIILKEREFRTDNFKETIWQITAPIVTHEKPIGSLEVCFLDDEESLVGGVDSIISDIASRISQAIERRHYTETLKKLSITDGLTKLYNSRYFSLRIKEELSRAKRHKSFLSLLMLDVDHFKLFNDTYGHSEGDRILAKLASTIRKVIQETALAFRYGGDEFMIILPENNEDDAKKVVDRIRNEWSRVFEKDPPSISIGSSTYDGTTEITSGNLVREADKGMYASRGIKITNVVDIKQSVEGGQL